MEPPHMCTLSIIPQSSTAPLTTSEAEDGNCQFRALADQLYGSQDYHDWNWLVVWNIFYFPIYWESSSQLTNIFQRGWNHQPQNKKRTTNRIAKPSTSKRTNQNEKNDDHFLDENKNENKMKTKWKHKWWLNVKIIKWNFQTLAARNSLNHKPAINMVNWGMIYYCFAKKALIWLVVWLPSILHFPRNIGLLSSSQLTHIFQRGGYTTTNQLVLYLEWWSPVDWKTGGLELSWTPPARDKQIWGFPKIGVPKKWMVGKMAHPITSSQSGW